MIIVRLIGGLGNQMFQYAAGRSLSQRHQVPLKLDRSYLLDRTPRKYFVYRDYHLNFFNIQEQFATPEETSEFKKYHQIEKNFKRINKVCPWLPGMLKQGLERIKVKFTENRPVYLCQNDNNLDQRFFDAPSHVYLEGYWQSEKYFSAIEPLLRKDFTFVDGLDERGKEMAERIAKVDSVCMNVRQGYAANPKEYEFHGVCLPAYFSSAADIVAKKLIHPHFFVFSDDIEWCRSHLRLDYPVTFVGHEYAGAGFRQYLQLMVQCQHYIIPNSSFGWWAAWLNTGPNKIIVAPRQWYRDPHVDTNGLYAKDWIKI